MVFADGREAAATTREVIRASQELRERMGLKITPKEIALERCSALGRPR